MNKLEDKLTKYNTILKTAKELGDEHLIKYARSKLKILGLQYINDAEVKE